MQNTKYKKKDQNLRFEFMNKHIRNQSKRREKRVSLSLKGFHYKTWWLCQVYAESSKINVKKKKIQHNSTDAPKYFRNIPFYLGHISEGIMGHVEHEGVADLIKRILPHTWTIRYNILRWPLSFLQEPVSGPDLFHFGPPP